MFFLEIAQLSETKSIWTFLKFPCIMTPFQSVFYPNNGTNWHHCHFSYPSEHRWHFTDHGTFSCHLQMWSQGSSQCVLYAATLSCQDSGDLIAILIFVTNEFEINAFSIFPLQWLKYLKSCKKMKRVYFKYRESMKLRGKGYWVQ